ncbi:acyltransferase [Methylomonas sp. AM2-LC]|uniref:acyltransferase family protein n=1 Tax=Methylomonas sp. AM2-LC TaxID=3153301 RepID=UPI00326563B3
MPTKQHIAYLDSIRGLAALTVLSEHFIIAYGLPCQETVCQYVLDYSPLHFWWDGGAAVSMFFVLSGLVLSLKYFRNRPTADLNQFSLMAYTIARLCRIWLPYCAVLAISALLYNQFTLNPPSQTPLPASDWITDLWQRHPLKVLDMLREAFLLKLPEVDVLLPQAWTLSIELCLSLLLPLALLITTRGTSWLVFFTLLAVCFLKLPVFAIHFVLGLLLAQQHALIADFLGAKPWLRRLIAVLGFMFYTLGDAVQLQIPEPLLWTSSGLGASLLLMYALSSERCQKVLCWWLFRLLGKVSYSSYLVHIAVLLCVTPYLLKGLATISAEHTLLWFGGWLLTVVVVQLLSLFSYYYLEIPCVSLGKRLVQHWYSIKTK